MSKPATAGRVLRVSAAQRVSSSQYLDATSGSSLHRRAHSRSYSTGSGAPTPPPTTSPTSSDPHQHQTQQQQQQQPTTRSDSSSSPTDSLTLAPTPTAGSSAMGAAQQSSSSLPPQHHQHRPDQISAIAATVALSTRAHQPAATTAAATRQQKAVAEATITGLLSKNGAFSTTCRLDAKSRKPVANFTPIDQRDWVPDAATSVCMTPICEVPFSLFTRRHHCRGCGLIFCSSCLRYLLNQTVETRAGGSVVSSIVPHRVCAICFYGGQLAVGQLRQNNNSTQQQQDQQNQQQQNGSTKNTHAGAHPFTECLIRPDLIEQVRYVSQDGGTAVIASPSSNTPRSNNNSRATINSTSSGNINQNNRNVNNNNNNNYSRNSPNNNDAVTPRRAAVVDDDQQEDQDDPEEEGNQQQEREQGGGQSLPPPPPPPPRTVVARQSPARFVSYWSSKSRLAAMNRRGQLRALPWVVLVAIAEFLPLAAPADDEQQQQYLEEGGGDDELSISQNQQQQDEEEEIRELSGSVNFAKRSTNSNALSNMGCPEGGGGLFSFSLVCSDFYFASRCNTVWYPWLDLLRYDGKWVTLEEDYEQHHDLLQQQQQPEPSSPVDLYLVNRTGSAVAGPPSLSIAGGGATAATANSSSSSASAGASTSTAAAASFTANSTTAGAAGAGEMTDAQQQAALPQQQRSGQFSQSPTGQQHQQQLAAPFSIFSEFIQEAATHRATQLSASGARVHKLLSQGIRLAFLGEEDSLRGALVRGFVIDPPATAAAAADAAAGGGAASAGNNSNNNNNNSAGQTPQHSRSGSTTAAGAASSLSPAGSPTSQTTATSSVFQLPDHTLGLSSFEQLIHVALTAEVSSPAAAALATSTGASSTRTESVSAASAVRQSSVRLYDIRAGRRYLTVGRMAAKSSHAAVICYDATSRDSLARAALLFTEVAGAVNSRVTLRVLCGVIPTDSSSSSSSSSTMIDADQALVFATGSAAAGHAQHVLSITVNLDDAVDAIEQIVQSVFSRTLRGDGVVGGGGGGGGAGGGGDQPRHRRTNSLSGGQMNSLNDGGVLAMPTVLDVLLADSADQIPGV